MLAFLRFGAVCGAIPVNSPVSKASLPSDQTHPIQSGRSGDVLRAHLFFQQSLYGTTATVLFAAFGIGKNGVKLRQPSSDNFFKHRGTVF